MIAHSATIIVIMAVKLSPSNNASKFNFVALNMIKTIAITVNTSVNIFICLKF